MIWQRGHPRMLFNNTRRGLFRVGYHNLEIFPVANRRGPVYFCRHYMVFI